MLCTCGGRLGRRRTERARPRAPACGAAGSEHAAAQRGPPHQAVVDRDVDPARHELHHRRVVVSHEQIHLRGGAGRGRSRSPAAQPPKPPTAGSPHEKVPVPRPPSNLVGAVRRDDEPVRRRQLPQLVARLLRHRDLLRLRAAEEEGGRRGSASLNPRGGSPERRPPRSASVPTRGGNNRSLTVSLSFSKSGERSSGSQSTRDEERSRL